MQSRQSFFTHHGFEFLKQIQQQNFLLKNRTESFQKELEMVNFNENLVIF